MVCMADARKEGILKPTLSESRKYLGRAVEWLLIQEHQKSRVINMKDGKRL